MYIADELMVHPMPTALYLKTEQCLSPVCIFSNSHIMTFLCVGMQKKKKVFLYPLRFCGQGLQIKLTDALLMGEKLTNINLSLIILSFFYFNFKF